MCVPNMPPAILEKRCQLLQTLKIHSGSYKPESPWKPTALPETYKCLWFERRPDVFVLVGGGALAFPVSLTASHPKVHLDGFRRLEGLVATGSFKGESIMAFLKRHGEECSLG